MQKLYRHSDLRTTIGYQDNFINKPADEALVFIMFFGTHKEYDKVDAETINNY